MTAAYSRGNVIGMAEALSSPIECCNQCPEGSEVDPVQIPGPAGADGPAGEDGCSGTNAYTIVQAPGFTQPAVGAQVTVTVGQSLGFGIGAPVWVEGGGTYEVISKPTTTSIRIENLGYAENAAPTTAIAAGSRMTQTGWKGTDGTSASGDMLGANNLSELVSASTSRTNLGATTAGANLFVLSNPSAVTFLRINADNTVTALSAAAFRTALTLVPGTDVQAFDAFLLSIAGLGTAADRIIYTTGVNVAAETVLTSYARTLIDDTDAVTARATLGKVLPRYGVLGALSAIDLNVANNDNAMSIEATRYRIDKVVFENASTSLTTATAGVFTGAGASGTTIAADQVLSALTAATKFKDLTLQAIAGTDTFTSGTIYIRSGTSQGGAATSNVFVVGWRFD